MVDGLTSTACKTRIRPPPAAQTHYMQCVPYGARTMWVHAYQSYLWNSMVCARIRTLGRCAVPGDLVLPGHDLRCKAGDDAFIPPGGSAADPFPGTCEEETDDSGGDNVAVGDGTLLVAGASDGDKMGCGERGGSGSGNGGGGGGVKESVSVLTRKRMEALAGEGVTAEELFRRVVLPLPGTAVMYPGHEVRE